jgi:hypothetical protein
VFPISSVGRIVYFQRFEWLLGYVDGSFSMPDTLTLSSVCRDLTDACEAAHVLASSIATSLADSMEAAKPAYDKIDESLVRSREILF